MIGLVFATQQEARPFLSRTGAQQVGAVPFPTYAPAGADLRVVVSGMGKVPAALAAQALLHQWHCSRLLNAGICGALVDRPALAPGRVVRIAKAVEAFSAPGAAADFWRCADDLWPELPTARLITVEQPVFDAVARERLARRAELVDMEGAVVARVAALHGISCAIVKGVSDTAGNGDRAELHRNMTAVSERIAAVLIDGIADYAQLGH